MCADVGVCDRSVAASVPLARAILTASLSDRRPCTWDAFLGGLARVNIYHPWKNVYTYIKCSNGK